MSYRLPARASARAVPAGRDTTMPVRDTSCSAGTPLRPWPEGMDTLIVGMGCFRRSRLFWQLPGVYTTAVGYSGGHTRIPPTRRRARR